ncbi:MAG: hypothetical protein U5N86_11735 [Planctomycetota bacterium]|nr:hypothetical protein [Planctomycetota bacterium]
MSNFERARSLLKAEAKAMDNDDRMMVLPFLELPAENGGRTVNRPLAPGPVLTTAINELRQGYGRGEPLSVLREAKELIADSDTLNREIYILSDFQSTTFERFNSQAIAEEIKEFGENVAVYAVDLSSRDLRSAAPRRGYFRSSGPSGDSTKVCGEVVNFSREKFDIKISLMIDGVKEAQQMYSLKSEERWPFEFDVTFSDMGFHKVAVLLEGDDIPGDNSLNLSFFSSPQLEVLLVNGRPSSVSP